MFLHSESFPIHTSSSISQVFPRNYLVTSKKLTKQLKSAKYQENTRFYPPPTIHKMWILIIKERNNVSTQNHQQNTSLALIIYIYIPSFTPLLSVLVSLHSLPWLHLHQTLLMTQLCSSAPCKSLESGGKKPTKPSVSWFS